MLFALKETSLGGEVKRKINEHVEAMRIVADSLREGGIKKDWETFGRVAMAGIIAGSGVYVAMQHTDVHAAGNLTLNTDNHHFDSSTHSLEKNGNITRNIQNPTPSQADCTTSYDGVLRPLNDGRFEFFNIAAIEHCTDSNGNSSWKNIKQPGEIGYVEGEIDGPGPKTVVGYRFDKTEDWGSGAVVNLYKKIK